MCSVLVLLRVGRLVVGRVIIGSTRRAFRSADAPISRPHADPSLCEEIAIFGWKKHTTDPLFTYPALILTWF